VVLKKKVDERIGNLKEPRWHYESRLKEQESFTLKMESGRVSDPHHLEDFFACTLVVENAQAIERAEKLVSDNFALSYRRPKRDDYTHKASNSFPFDNLRIYVKWVNDLQQKAIAEIENIVFEIQIKTFLQHAWDIATHDLLYKSDTISWPKERIAFQIKAMLEHAEVSISEVEKTAESVALNKTNKETKELLEIILLIRNFWQGDLLPKNKVILARNILSLLRSVGLSIGELTNILTQETEAGRGAKTLNLSPFCAIVQSLFNCALDKMISYLENGNSSKILIASEIGLPELLEKAKCKCAIFVD
jgi:ppGpp synthetase/RelA/SpoT-type nucleotidyltranferase